MSEQSYNGWTNYETWRINLEILDDYADAYPETIEECAAKDNVSDLVDILKEYVDEALTQFGELKEPCLALDYARSFVQEVNFHEIAEHMIADWKSNQEYEAKKA